MKKLLSNKLVTGLVKMALMALLTTAATRAARWAINEGEKKLRKLN